ncbi:g8417 [Coccomyxa elongata]
MQAGAERRELHKNVYRRLNMGVVTFATAALAAEVIHLDVLDIAASTGMATILGITVAVPSYYYAMTSGHGLGLWSIMKARPLPHTCAPFKANGVVRELDVLGRVKTGKGVAYALLAPAFYGAGLACMLTPSESLTNVFLYAHGEDCITTLWRMFGASLLMLPTWAVSLKEAADRRHLDRPPYITLNMGLALTGLINVAILSPWWTQYSAGPVMPLMLGTWAAAAAVGIWGELTPTSADPITQP